MCSQNDTQDRQTETTITIPLVLVGGGKNVLLCYQIACDFCLNFLNVEATIQNPLRRNNEFKMSAVIFSSYSRPTGVPLLGSAQLNCRYK